MLVKRLISRKFKSNCPISWHISETSKLISIKLSIEILRRYLSGEFGISLYPSNINFIYVEFKSNFYHFSEILLVARNAETRHVQMLLSSPTFISKHQ
jgi:hypothetical protein